MFGKIPKVELNMSHRTFYSTKTVDVDKKLTRATPYRDLVDGIGQLILDTVHFIYYSNGGFEK